MQRRKRPTIKEVARLAGVSIGTVSNVINGLEGVRAETRNQVQRAIAELGYRPNTIARSLIARRSRLPEWHGGPPSAHLTTVGYLSVDYTARVDRLPVRDDRMTAAAITKSLGGPAANVAVMAAGLGEPLAVDCELITSLGDDADSDWALAELAERGVKTIGIRGPGEQRLSRCVVLVEPNGSRTIVNEPFVLEVDSVLPYVGPADPGQPHCVHLDGFQVEPMARSVPALRQRGLMTSVHTTGLHADWRSEDGFRRLCGLFDLVFLNRDLAREIIGPASDDDALIAGIGRVAADARRDSGWGIVVLTLGTVGAAAFEAGRDVVRATAPAVEVVDTTGAGDTFAGVFLAVHLSGRPVEEALRLATEAGSRSVTVAGAQGLRLRAADLIGYDRKPATDRVAATPR